MRYSRRHPEAAASLDTWYRVTCRAEWSSFAHVRSVFPNADRVGEGKRSISKARAKRLAEFFHVPADLFI